MQKSIENQPRPSTRVFVHGWHLIGLAALGSRPAIYIDNHVPTRRALDIELLSRHSPRYSRICNYAALRESVHHSTLAFLLFRCVCVALCGRQLPTEKVPHDAHHHHNMFCCRLFSECGYCSPWSWPVFGAWLGLAWLAGKSKSRLMFAARGMSSTTVCCSFRN